MKLDELLKINKSELEIFDTEIDTKCSYIVYGSEYCYEDNEEEKNLQKLEKWFRGLEVETIKGECVYVDAYTPMRNDWEELRQKLIKEDYNYSLEETDTRYLDNECADYVDDIYTTLSQGYYGFAKDFVKVMEL